MSALCPLHSNAAASPKAFVARCSKICIAALCLSVLCLRRWLFHEEKKFSCFTGLHVAIFPSNICYLYGDAQGSPKVLSPSSHTRTVPPDPEREPLFESHT